MAYSFAGFIGIGKESAWGTPVAVTDYVAALNENLTLTRDRFEVVNILNRFAEPNDIAGASRLAGSIAFAGHPVTLGYFLNGALGNLASQSVVLSGFLWTNTFQPAITDNGADNPVPPYTFEIFRDVTSSHRYSGVQMNRLQLQMQPNQDLRVTADVIAKTTSVFAKTTASFPGSSADPFTFDTCSVSVAGAGSALYENISVTFDNQAEGVLVLNNSTDIVRIRRRGPQLVRVSGTLGFDNLTEYNNFVNQTEQIFAVSFTKAASFQCVVELPSVVYTTFPLGMSGRQRQTVGFDGMARYNAGSGYAVRVKLTTTKSNY